MNRKLCALAVLLAGLIASWGCMNNQEVKIGVIIPKEGSLADYGYQIISGIEMAEEDIREMKQAGKGFVVTDDEGQEEVHMIDKNYTIIFENESSDPNKVDVAVESFENLRKKGVTAIIGAASSSATLALAPLAGESEIILLSPASSSPRINQNDDKFVYRNYPSDTLEAQALSNVIFHKCSLQKVLMVRSKNAYAEGITYELLRFARKSSSKLPDHVIKFASDPAEVDFVAVVDQIVADAPNAVFLGSYTDALIPLIKEIKSRAELKEIFIFTSSSFLPGKVVKALGPETVEDIIFTSYPWDPGASEQTAEFAKEFDSKFGIEPTIYAAAGYDALMTLVKAIDDVNHVLASEVRAALAKEQYQGLLGETDFNKRGDVTRIPEVYWMKNGVATVLTSEDMETIKRKVLVEF